MVSGKVLTDPGGKRRKRGLRWEILVSLGLIMFSGVLFMGVTALKAAERAVFLREIESLERVTRSVQMILSSEWNEDAPGMKDDRGLGPLLRYGAAVLGLSGIKVVDTSGKVIASLREEERGSMAGDPVLIRALKTKSLIRQNEVSGRLPEGPKGTWVIAAPVYRGGTQVGAFSITFPMEDLATVLRFHRKVIFTFAMIDGIFIVLFGGWFIGRVVVTPLVKISRGAQALAQGDFDTRVRIRGPREVEELASTFNHMADRIQEEVLKREEHLAALERVNRELKEAQQEMVRVEKMASVGKLAAGIAHEIGNPLAAVLGYTSILQRENHDLEAAQYLGHIEKETVRIQKIIRGLLEFSRPRDLNIEELDMEALIKETMDLVTLQPVFRGVRVDLALENGDLMVRGDRHQIQQVLINILLNAAQATEGGGTLRVAARSRELLAGEGGIPRRRSTDRKPRRATDPKNVDYVAMRGDFPDLPDLREGEAVVEVVIEDSGPGIPREILGRVFDPFFTTKGTGEGTGLGLSIAYGIVEGHGGILLAGNREEGGARFTILFPGKRNPETGDGEEGKGNVE